MRKILPALVILPLLAACSPSSSESGSTTSSGPTTIDSSQDSTTESTQSPSSSVNATTVDDGTYKLGDKGPGGGIIFYIGTKPFPCGESLETLCTYLEAAPPEAETDLPWTTDDNLSTRVSSRMSGALGSGWVNSLLIQSQIGNDGKNSAAGYSLEYQNNGVSDWYLPTTAELDQLCAYARQTPEPTTEPGCPIAAEVRPGFAVAYYWTSTESDLKDDEAYAIVINTGPEVNSVLGSTTLGKSKKAKVRPIRAF